LLRGREYVLPGDIRELAVDVLAHRLVLSFDALAEGVSAETLVQRVVSAVPVPVVAPLQAEVA
jgi:MoxR-like ATPase